MSYEVKPSQHWREVVLEELNLKQTKELFHHSNLFSTVSTTFDAYCSFSENYLLFAVDCLAVRFEFSVLVYK